MAGNPVQRHVADVEADFAGLDLNRTRVDLVSQPA